MAKRKKQKQKFRGLPFLILMTLFCVIGVTFLLERPRLQHKADLYAAQIAELEKEYEQEKNRTDELEIYKEYINSQQFKEAVARDKFGLIYDDEIVIKPE